MPVSAGSGRAQRPVGVRPSERPARPRARLARPRRCRAAPPPPASPGSRSTTGVPSSPPSRSGCRAGSGRAAAPSAPTDRVSESATAWPPPEPKISWRDAVGQLEPGHVLDDADDPLVGLQRDRAGPLGHLGGGLLRGGDHEDLGVGQELGRPRSRCRRCPAAGRAAARRGRPRRRRRGTAAARGAASGRARRRAGCPGTNMPIEMTFTPCADRRHDHVVDLGRPAARRRACAGPSGRRCRRRRRRPRRPCCGQRGGQVDGHRGLADAALAGGDRVDPGQRVRAWRTGSRAPASPPRSFWLQAGALLVAHHAEGHVDAGDAGDARPGPR